MFARALLAAAAFAATTANAQLPAQPTANWPAQAVRIIVPYPAGAGIDFVARVLADRLARSWGRPVIVDNRPGANSIIGTEAAARAAPDGYTLLFSNDATFTLFPHLYAHLPFDPQRDFVPITRVVTFYNMLVVHPSVGAGNLQELIAIAKARPGHLTYATIGSGSAAHLLGEWLSHDAKIEMLHVPYKGVPQTVAAVLAGETHMTWAGVNSAQAFIDGGRLKAIAVAAPGRLPLMPDVPTFTEAGLPGIEHTQWFGLFAPAATPRAVVDRIHRDVARVLADPDVRDRELKPKAWEPSGLAPVLFAAEIERERAIRGVVVKLSGAKVD